MPGDRTLGVLIRGGHSYSGCKLGPALRESPRSFIRMRGLMVVAVPRVKDTVLKSLTSRAAEFERSRD